MSGYSRNAIYTRLRNALTAANPSIYCTSKYVAKPASFPAAYIHEIDRSRPIQYTQLDFQDNQYESVYEIQVSSAKANTAMTEAYDLMAVVRETMSALYYREFTETNVDGGTQFTVIGRFRRVIGGGDTMPNT